MKKGKYSIGIEKYKKLQDSYDFSELVKVHPPLAEYVYTTPKGKETIYFEKSAAVFALNKALLKAIFNIKDWNLPPHYLCPGVPGRATYIDALAGLLAEDNEKIPLGNQVVGLDIGTGAGIIYPILAHGLFRWTMYGSDIDAVSIENGNRILDANPQLKGWIYLVHQKRADIILKDILNSNFIFDFVMCNPPFFKSIEDAKSANARKSKNLSQQSQNFNFQGVNNELVTAGGELEFIGQMIEESRGFDNKVLWYSSLVSKEKNLKLLIRKLQKLKIKEYRVLPLHASKKKQQVLVWSFLNAQKRKKWCELRFTNK